VLNIIFVVIVLASILLAAFTGRMEDLTLASVNSAKDAVMLALGLIGVMAFFLGLMKVAESGGILRVVTRLAHPILRRLFPGIPEGHPAMNAMVMNIASNMLGLANAATPFGIKAIMELNRLNRRKGTATNAMIMFLAINTSGLAFLPSGVISVRAAAGSVDPAGILVTTWFASGCATVVGITVALLLSRLPQYARTEPGMVVMEEPVPVPEQSAGESAPDLVPPRGGLLITWIILLAYLAALVRYLAFAGGDGAGTVSERLSHVFSFWLLPALIGGLVLFGWARGVRVYDCLVEGAKEGWEVAKRIIPYLVAILVAVGMMRASGGIDLLGRALGGVTAMIGMPAEALPMAVMRPLSGSGALGVMAEILNTHGPDSFVGYMVSTFQGSTETTFYVLAVYFGAVGVKRTRHALPSCLAADLAGIMAAVFIVNLLFG
jgi:spore maturation protein SpmA/spore maturation protein SpmB